MSIFRTIALFVYLFGYMIVHYSVLCKAERALAAGDTETVRQLVKKHIPHWSKGILNVTGVRLSVEGLDNIPKDGPCVFVANHRSYYDIPLLLAGLDEPYGILAKEELGKIPLLNRWMKLLGCVFVKRDDIRASVKALRCQSAGQVGVHGLVAAAAAGKAVQMHHKGHLALRIRQGHDAAQGVTITVLKLDL